MILSQLPKDISRIINKILYDSTFLNQLAITFVTNISHPDVLIEFINTVKHSDSDTFYNTYIIKYNSTSSMINYINYRDPHRYGREDGCINMQMFGFIYNFKLQNRQTPAYQLITFTPFVHTTHTPSRTLRT